MKKVDDNFQTVDEKLWAWNQKLGNLFISGKCYT